jgi:predicted XRE-type DNA-binding protein
MTGNRYDSVWDAISDTPEEAANMKLRSVLMIHIEGEIRRRGWTQAEAAVHLGVTQPRVSDLMRGKIGLFGLDNLVNMVAAMGEAIEVRFRPHGASLRGEKPRPTGRSRPARRTSASA